MISKTDYQYIFNPEACNTCKGRCCNGERGNIWVSKKEIAAISKLLGIPVGGFIQNYLRKVGYRHSIKELKSGTNYACLFFDNKKNGCSIYSARPVQCRTFPFWPYFKKNPDDIFAECPGVSLKDEAES